MRLTSSRVVAGIAAAALAVVSLTACSGGAGTGGGCTPLATSGTASDSVSVTGSFGTAPTVSFPKPLHVDATEASTVIRGAGAAIRPAQQIVADVTFLDATTGVVATASEYAGDAAAARFVVGNVPLPGLRKALACAQVGDRIAAVIPPRDGIPAASRPQTIAAGDSIVAVVDVRKAYLARADGVDQVMAGGLPAVVLAPDGRPGITLPEGNPPSTLQVADLQKGSGALIRRGDDVVVHYTGVLWKPGDAANGTVFDSSWADGSPRTLQVTNGQIVPGLVTALAGQRVGSQVLAVLPPSQAYGDQASGTVPAGSTLVFVVDVLGKA